MKLTETPVCNLFELTIATDKLDQFIKAVIENMSVSIKNEPGTLLLMLASQTQDPSMKYLFEIYQNQAAYQIHLNSLQFKRCQQLIDQTSQACITNEILLEKASFKMPKCCYCCGDYFADFLDQSEKFFGDFSGINQSDKKFNLKISKEETHQRIDLLYYQTDLKLD